MKSMIQIVLILLTFAAFSSCAKHEDHKNASKDTNKTEKSLYTCPMHPQIKKDAPGTCPICMMSLVKIENEEDIDHKEVHSDHAAFELAPERRQLIGVKTAIVEKKHLVHTITAPGKVAFDPELYAAQSEYFVALRQYEELSSSPIADVKKSAKQVLDSAKLRLKVLGLSDEQLKKLDKRKELGAQSLLPQKGENLLIYADVFEMDIRKVVPGLEVKVSGESLEGSTLKGKVVSVDRIINPITRTAKVRIEISNAQTLLRSESYVDVEILSPMGEEVAVPQHAILDTGKVAYVYVMKNGGKFEPRKVQVKFYADDEAAIASGVEAGERVVTSSNFLIDSESRLKAVLQGGNESSPKVESKPACPPW